MVLNLHHLPHTIDYATLGDGSDSGARPLHLEKACVLGSAGGHPPALPMVGADTLPHRSTATR